MNRYEDEYLRRADGSIYGVKPEAEKRNRELREAQDAYANLATLNLSYDGAAYEIDLGPRVYGLVDYDGEYRVGLYFASLDIDETDDGGVCATFENFVDVEAFVERLRAIRYEEATR